VGVPARLWSVEGRRGGAPASTGTVRRHTRQSVGEGRWDAGVHGQDCILDIWTTTSAAAASSSACAWP
jgi:hypothetical protein